MSTKRSWTGQARRFLTDKEKAITHAIHSHPAVFPFLVGTGTFLYTGNWAAANRAAAAADIAQEHQAHLFREIATGASDALEGASVVERDVRKFVAKFHSRGSSSSTSDYTFAPIDIGRLDAVGGSSHPPTPSFDSWRDLRDYYGDAAVDRLQARYINEGNLNPFSRVRDDLMSSHTREGVSDPGGAGAARSGRGASRRGTENPNLKPTDVDMNEGDPAAHAGTRTLVGGGHRMFVTREDLLANPYRSLRWSIRSPFPPVLLTTLYREFEFSLPVMVNALNSTSVDASFGMSPLIRIFCNTLGSNTTGQGYGAWPYHTDASDHIGNDVSHALRDLELYNWNSAAVQLGGLCGVLAQSAEQVPWQRLLAKIYSNYCVYGSRLHIKSTNHVGDEDTQDMEKAITPVVRWNLNCALNTASTGNRSIAGDPTDKYPDYLKHSLCVQPSATTFGQVCITNYGEKEMGGFNQMHPLHHRMTRSNTCYATRTNPTHTELSGTWNLKHHEGFSVGDVIEGRDPFFIEQDDTSSKNSRALFAAATADSVTVPHTADAGTAYWDIFPTPIRPDDNWVNTYKNCMSAHDLMTETGLVSATTDDIKVTDPYTGSTNGATTVAGPWMNLKIMVEYDVAFFDMVPDSFNPGEPKEKHI